MPRFRSRRAGARRARRPAAGSRTIRFLPRRFDAYIAWSALIIRSSAVRPVVGDRSRRRSRARCWIRAAAVSIASSATPWRIFSARTSAPVGLRLGEEDDELVAAVAGRRVDPPDAVADDLADAAQDPVALEVAEPVVDRLEPVEIHHQQAEPPARTRALRWISRSTAAKK